MSSRSATAQLHGGSQQHDPNVRPVEIPVAEDLYLSNV
jgi:hypothetical protein